MENTGHAVSANPTRNRIRRIILIISFACFIIWLTKPAHAGEPFILHMLDVGQGQSILIETDGHYLLIDGGGRDASSFVISYLKQQGVLKLDYIIASHYDEDHIAGLIGALSVFPVDYCLLPSYRGEGKLYQSFCVAAVSNGCTIEHPGLKSTYSIGNAQIEVAGPVSSDYAAENDRSLAVRVSFGDTSYLICGDAEHQAETDMVNCGEDLHSDLYVVDHHGSNTSSTDAFLNRVSPEYALISCGRDNAFGHPATETLQRLKDHGCTVYRTDKQGTVIAYSDGNIIWFNKEPYSGYAGGDDDNSFIMGENRMDELIRATMPDLN